MATRVEIETDVAIVGAGFAGLQAARELTKRGLRVEVLEARDRVGGRVQTTTLDDGTWLDVGGQWFGPGQNRCYRLAAELGKRTYTMYLEGKNLLRYRGRLLRYRGTVPIVPDPVALPASVKAVPSAVAKPLIAPERMREAPVSLLVVMVRAAPPRLIAPPSSRLLAPEKVRALDCVIALRTALLPVRAVEADTVEAPEMVKVPVPIASL